MKKIIAYTSVFSNRDEPLCLKKDPLVHYILFTDVPTYHNDSFDEIIYCKMKLSTRMTSRQIKCLPHKFLPNHEFSIWFDACMRPNSSNLSGIAHDSESIKAYSHRLKFTISDIVNNCINHRWDYPKKIKKQSLRYLTEGLPSDINTFETGILLRQNNLEINKFNEFWWSEILNGSERDQISFPYCLWKLNIKCHPISNDNATNVASNTYFHYIWHPHTTPKEIKML